MDLAWLGLTELKTMLDDGQLSSVELTDSLLARIAQAEPHLHACVEIYADAARALARELGSRNVTVNCVAPGFIETDMTASLQEEQQKALLGQIPLGHLGKPSDIAHAVAYLASPQASYVTGQELHVNGGMYM